MTKEEARAKMEKVRIRHEYEKIFENIQRQIGKSGKSENAQIFVTEGETPNEKKAMEFFTRSANVWLIRTSNPKIYQVTEVGYYCMSMSAVKNWN